MRMLSENAEKGKLYFIRGKKDWLRVSSMFRNREIYRVIKPFEDSDTGVIVKSLEHGLELDIPQGVEFVELVEAVDPSEQLAGEAKESQEAERMADMEDAARDRQREA